MGADIAQILAIGGPSSIVGVVVYVLYKALADWRKDRREDDTHQNTTETGIIDNTKRVMDLVRGETERLEAKNLQLEQNLEIVRRKAQECEDEAARQKRRADGLEEEVHRLERRMLELEGRVGDGTT